MASKKQQPKIKVTKNGPYIFSGKIPLNEQIINTAPDGTPLKWVAGTVYPEKEAYALVVVGSPKISPFVMAYTSK